MKDNPISKYYLFITTFFLIIFDLVLSFVYSNNYDVNLFKGTGYFIPLLINVGFLFYIAMRFQKWYLYIVPSILSFLLGIYFVWILITNSLVSWQYDDVHSPIETETLTIKHRSAMLGETTFFYEFYKKSFRGLFIKKLDKSDLEIILRDTQGKDDLEVLNIQSPTWVNETTIIFHTIEGDKTIILD
ncbi:hypothetical protein H1230_16635 [Paenibacillus sp. 19GGS1-52]|uniref:hypothetical protein n=1 Tax=Paenibacillus sp. 19GGS1-52 TaxID=2758563 RepID=UPI001EFA9E8C|nr:hypothetical protein [Paenibacillus sp. 19GGS1-52]ULO04782.1 hypothetical protein H1230_16635 [Paenibacillus sp. 19GGS1-52]